MSVSVCMLVNMRLNVFVAMIVCVWWFDCLVFINMFSVCLSMSSVCIRECICRCICQYASECICQCGLSTSDIVFKGSVVVLLLTTVDQRGAHFRILNYINL